MLTQSEREWLASRKDACSYCSDIPRTMCLYGERPAHCARVDIDWQDVAEFSERVAAKLADAYWPPLVYTPVAPFEQIFMPPMDRLKWARIKVEEEMDNGIDI